jgi:hypothetical protein
MRFPRILTLTLTLIAGILPSLAESQTSKKPLAQADWDRWRSITAPTLSPDGKWAAYTLTPQVGDGEFVVRSTTGNTEIRIPVGYIGRANNIPGGLRAPGAAAGGPGGGAAGAFGGRGEFSPDSRFAIVTVGASKTVVDSVARAQAMNRPVGRGGRGGGGGGGGGGNPGAGGAGGQAPTNPATRLQFVIIKLADGTQTMVDGRNPCFATDNGKWLLYSPDNVACTEGDASAGGGGRGGRGGGGGRGRGAAGGAAADSAGGGARRRLGGVLVIRNMETSAEERLADVLSARFDDSAKVLAYTVASRDSTKDGVFIRTMATGATQTVMTGQGNYRAFAFDHAQQQFVFASDRGEFGKDKARSTIYVGSLKAGTATPVITPAMWPNDMRVPDNGGAPTFTRAGNAIVFQLGTPPEDTIPADSLVGKAIFDLWNYKDPELQPTQKLRLAQERNKTYQSIFNLTTKKIVQLAGDTITTVQLSDDAKVGVATSGVRYSIESMWHPGQNDVYLIDPATASRRMIAERVKGQAELSPDAKYVTYYNDQHWFVYNIATSKTVDVSAPLKNVHFEQETWSTPDEPSAWGIAGWTKGDKSLLINDRFDIWEIDPTGVKPAVVVTDSVGRKNSITFRIINIDPEEGAVVGGGGGGGGRGGGGAGNQPIDPAKPLMLSAFSEATKAGGWYRDQLGVVKPPEKILMGDYRYGGLTKAKHAEEYMYTRSTAVEFPNLWTGPAITSVQKISDANPWQKEYNWVTSELVTWTSDDGVPLQGILYKPENFDPTKKYPMVSYFYEELSDGLYGYVAPNGRNTINPTHYASNGYLVFEPDIHYETGHPGQSAMKSIVPGVQMLIAKGFVDAKKMGLQGQSWGGYQTAYMITQTHMFAAAMAGAPVANMTSAYGGIRWGSGVNRSMQYENGQSRIGKDLWDGEALYLENSPLFHLPYVQTPLFLMSNDMDDAVPWYQGIELFVGMRRLGKEAYMISYNNDVHNPASRANQKDIAMRMQQFFDAKLKGAPEPKWMTDGIPAKDKGKDQVNMPALQAGKVIRP